MKMVLLGRRGVFRGGGAPRAAAARGTHTFFFEHVVGANGTAAHEGSQGSPLFTHVAGGMPPKIYQLYVLPPHDHPFPQLDRNHTPT